MKKISTLICAIAFIVSVKAQAPSNIVATPVSSTVARYDKFELDVTLTAGYTNPYDYDDISIRLAVLAPSGRKDTVDGFFMQDYTLNTSNGALTTAGSGSFKIRYTPNETGAWQYTVIATNTAGTATTTAQTFNCTSSAAKGFIRKNTTNYLAFESNDQYIPVGQNQAWQQGNIYLDYKSWLQKLSNNKANTIRIWQAVWGLGIEWKNGTDGYLGLKKYKQTSAWYTDWLLEECRSKGIYIMFCINHHGMVSSQVNPNWPESPYNAANGGPCANTWDFFTDATAKALHKNRLRYIVARWGYSQNVMSWELFNEVEWTDNFNAHKTEVTAWHAEMANYLKSIDINKHLVTTSYANNANDPNTWNIPAIDFTQVHNYIGSPNVENALAGAVGDNIAAYNKPAINGEFGIDAASSNLSSIDPTGIYIHNSIWATAFSGAMGAGMSWWWDTYIDPQNLYTHYKPLSEFIATLALKNDNYKKTSSSASGGGTSDLTLTPGVGFALAGASSYTIDAGGNIMPSASQLSNYLFGQFNSQYKSAPTFTVTYPAAGQFKVVTGSTISGSGARINIYLNGASVLDQVAAVNSTYTINVPAGTATIKVDNLGLDWISIANYIFTNIGSPLNTYMLKSADSKKIAGWIHNKKYNWQTSASSVPVNGATLAVPAAENGTYSVQFINCETGASVSTATATATGGTLSVALPTVTWDLGMTAVWTGVATGVIDLVTAKELKVFPNPAGRSRLFITYNLASRSRVNVDLFDIKGNKIAVIFSGTQPAGEKLLEWKENRAIAPGVYIVRFMIGKEMATRKVEW